MEKAIGDPPPRARCRSGRAAAARRGPAASGRRRKPEPGARPARSSTSTAAAPTTTSPTPARMAVEVLEHNGLEVIVPKQGCCGLPLQSNGLFDDARGYVRRLAARLAPYARAGHDIVATSTSCGLMLKREAREILGRRGRRPARGRRAPLRHLRVPRDAPRARRARHRLLPPLDDGRALPRPLPAARATASAPRRMRADGAWSRGCGPARSTRSAAASPAPTG